MGAAADLIPALWPNNLIEKELGVPATTRNWNTAGKMAALASS